MQDTLFLHMGPGLNAHCERVLLGAQRPKIEYWDQPTIQNHDSGFADLVAAVCGKIIEMHSQIKKPVNLVAHSFGGHLATAVIRQIPDKVGTCEFVSTGYDIPGGFYNLLSSLGRDRATPASLQLEIADFLQSHPAAEPGRIWEYFGLITRDPDFLRLYWPNADLYLRHAKIARTGPHLDPTTFQNVLASFIEKSWSFEPESVDWPGSISIRLGLKDPLIVFEREKFYWNRIYPNCSIEAANDSGHYLHLESSLALLKT